MIIYVSLCGIINKQCQGEEVNSKANTIILIMLYQKKLIATSFEMLQIWPLAPFPGL